MKQNNNFEKKRKKVYCNNCGKFGHYYRQCLEPIISYGIIGFCLLDDDISKISENTRKSQKKVRIN